VRISDLSRSSGVPVPTIKFYLREGLLEPGKSTARNQAIYNDSHLQRIRLIRVFTVIAQLELSAVRKLLRAIDNENLTVRQLYGVVHSTLATGRVEPEGTRAHTADLDEFIKDLGWRVSEGCPGRDILASVLAALSRIGGRADVQLLAPYARAVEALVATDLELLPKQGDVDDPGVAVATAVLLEIALIALRRMALQHYLELRG
jgi:DNA-binding transcriptional MerR regulator